MTAVNKQATLKLIERVEPTKVFFLAETALLHVSSMLFSVRLLLLLPTNQNSYSIL